MDEVLYTHKQALIVRKDLKMKPGKVAAQCAHGALGAVLSLAKRNFDGSRDIPADPRLVPWLDGKFTKPVLAASDEQELLDLKDKAEKAGLITCLIVDSGYTVFNGVPTTTVLAIGPDTIENIDAIAGHLKLY